MTRLSKSQAKALIALTQKKYRIERAELLVEGVRQCEEALSSGLRVKQVVFCDDLLRGQRSHALLEDARQRGVTVVETDRRTLERLSRTEHSQGVIAVVSASSANLEEVAGCRRGFTVILDQVSDPGNVGTILRTAAWFGARGAVLGSGSVEWTNPKVVRASAGALFHLPVIHGVETETALRLFREHGFSLLAADVANGERLRSGQPWPEKLALLLGNEARGVRSVLRPLVDRVIRIPRGGYGDSLNVAVAAGILMAAMVLDQE